jgi:signal transduction histidine kinase
MKVYRKGLSFLNDLGFGLGLSLAGKIIKIHKVTIDVQSDTGEGSLFVIKLPAAHSLHI